MGILLGFVVAVLIVGSLLAIAGAAVAAVAAVVATVRANRADAVLRADLDHVLADVLGPRSAVDDQTVGR